MGLTDKIRAAVDQTAASAKAKIGAVTHDPALQAEGHAQNAVGHAKQSDSDSGNLEERAREIADRPGGLVHGGPDLVCESHQVLPPISH